jgi:hypothetical protein
MLSTGRAREFFSDLDVLALLLAALVHDIGHDGFTNSFHKHRLTDRALLYNDQSIQENFHIWTLFDQLADRPDINIFHQFTASQFAEVRRLLVFLVLSTDMSKHFSLVQDIRSLTELNGREPAGWAETSGPLLAFLLHACDIAGQAKAKDLALTWATRVFAEFFRQGDCEKELGLPLSPLCDRTTTAISTAEIGFIKFIMQPTFELLGQLLPAAAAACQPELAQNLEYWREREERANRLKAADPAADAVKRRASLCATSGPPRPGRRAGRQSPIASPRRSVLQVASRWHRRSVV